MMPASEEQRAKWRAANERYRIAHPERGAENAARYRRRHPDRIHWGTTNPARNAWLGANGRFGEIIGFDLWLRVWNGSCFGCGKKPAHGVDHIVPKVEGGRNVEGNIQPGCWPCNQKKESQRQAVAFRGSGNPRNRKVAS